MDGSVERIQEMGAIEALVTLMEKDAAVRHAWAHKPGWLKSATQDRAIAVRACEGLGMTVIRTMMAGNVKGVILPKHSSDMDWLALSLKEREPVSVPGLGEDVGSHGYYDPCDQALINSGGLKDV